MGGGKAGKDSGKAKAKAISRSHRAGLQISRADEGASPREEKMSAQLEAACKHLEELVTMLDMSLASLREDLSKEKPNEAAQNQQTLSGRPPVPSGLRASARGPGWVQVAWRPPASTDEGVKDELEATLGYRIFLDGREIGKVGDTKTTERIALEDEDSEHRVQVRAVGQQGESEMTPALVIQPPHTQLIPPGPSPGYERSISQGSENLTSEGEEANSENSEQERLMDAARKVMAMSDSETEDESLEATAKEAAMENQPEDASCNEDSVEETADGKIDSIDLTIVSPRKDESEKPKESK